jgi:glycosyltransferase involved in cell wall biosynthesis
MASSRPQVLLLWHSLAGYMAAGIRALAEKSDVTVVARPPDPLAPYDYSALDLNGAELQVAEWPRPFSVVDQLIERTRPDIVCCIDRNRGVLRALHRARRRYGTTTVMVADYNWFGTWRQRLLQTLFTAVRPYAFDAAFVPGARSAEYARRLGFSPKSVFTGLYTIDQTRFTSVAAGSADRVANPSFLFCGRLVPEKAPDVLADAYRIYRKSVAQPWPLQVVGHGPFDGGLGGMPGVRMSDFVQPAVLAGMYADAGALILPSRFDCWGVVALEACSAGLPVVISDGCGVADELATPANGFTVPAEDPDSLAAALASLSEASLEQRKEWGRHSSEKASTFSPEHWAETVLSMRR